MDADFLLYRLDVHSVQPAVEDYSGSAGEKLCQKERNKSPLGNIQHHEECGREENNNLPQEREEELKNQREEDRVFIQRITHQLLRVRRTIKRHIEDSAFREDCIPER